MLEKLIITSIVFLKNNNKIEIQKEFVKQYKNEIFPFLKGHEVLRKRLKEVLEKRGYTYGK